MDERGAPGEEPREEGSRPGPLYDLTLKDMFGFDLPGACELLGVEVEGEPVPLTVEFTLTSRVVDLLVRVGPGRLMHLEYARRAERDLVPRMLVYRGLIMQMFPKDLVEQHVLVLGEGEVAGYRDYARNDFALNLRVHYLRSADPERFLGTVNFAPLAILRRGDPTEVEKVATQVVEAVRARGGDRTEELLKFVSVLAVIASDPDVVEKIIEETEMTVQEVADFYRDTRFGLRLRSEGREEAREELLTALLIERFGEHPELPDLVQRFVHWPDAAAVHAISAATDLAELQRATPPD